MLETIQKTLLADIHNGTRNLGQFLDDRIPNIDERIDIFVANRRFGQLDYLKSVYSVVAQILGDEYFEKIALEFVDNSIQSSGNRHEYGAGFQEFLRDHTINQDLCYLPEIAAIGWAHFCAYLAQDTSPISMEQIQSKLGIGKKFGIALSPSTSIFRTKYNSLEIWKAHQNADFENIILREQEQKYICWRNLGDEILFSPIMPEMVNFLENPDLSENFLGALEQTLASISAEPKIEEFQIQFAQFVIAELFILNEDI